MANHLKVLAELFKVAGLTQAEVAKSMSYDAPSMISMALKGKRNLGRKELLKMCEIAGVTLAELASLSDDLPITKTKEAVQAASIIDGLPENLRKDALDFIKGLSAQNKHKKL